MVKLVLTHNGVVLKSFIVDKESMLFGRRGSADVLLDDAVVSGQHARLFRVPSDYLDDYYEFYIEDLGSTNGTVVNGKKIAQPVLLKHGDTIQVGRHKFTFDTGQGINHEQTAIYLPDND